MMSNYCQQIQLKQKTIINIKKFTRSINFKLNSMQIHKFRWNKSMGNNIKYSKFIIVDYSFADK